MAIKDFHNFITKDPPPLHIDVLKSPTNLSDTAAKDEQMTGGDGKKGVMMLAKPYDNDDHVFNLYEDPKAKTGNQKVTAPTPVRVDMSDTIDNYVKVTEVPEHPEIKPGYGYKGSVRNTDAIFKAMEAGGFGSDKTERDVYLANINHESAKGTTYAEGTNYDFPSFSGFKRESECGAKPGTAGNEQGKGANGQATKYCAAYVAAGLPLESDFASWDAAKKANLMYGVEGKTLPNGADANLGDWAKYPGLGNTSANDGNRYRGRGAIQLTGKSNYKSVNEKLNKVDESGKSPYQKVTGTNDTVDIVSNPESVSNDEYLANLVSALYWRDSVHSAVAGKDAEAALKSSRQKVNSGCGVSEVTTQYNQLEGYDAAYETYQNEKSGAPAADKKASDDSGEITGHSKGDNKDETPAIEYPSIDVDSAIKYNKNKNPGMLEYIQTYLGLEKTSEFDELTVKTIAKWQEESGELKVDGKFGDKSFDYAMKHGLDKIMPTMLDEVVVTGHKDDNNNSGDNNSNNIDDVHHEGGDQSKEDAEIGDTGEDFGTLELNCDNKKGVTVLQKYLNKYLSKYSQIPKITTFGTYGEMTFKRVGYYQYSRNIQNSRGIDVDGVCGPKTWSALRENKAEEYDITQPKVFSGYQCKGAYTGTDLSAGGTMSSAAAAAFEKMNTAAQNAGFSKIKQASTYRGMTDFETKAGSNGGGTDGQIELFHHWGGDTNSCAKPGSSNHQQGLAIDISGLQKTNDTSDFYYWLHDNTKGADGKYTTNTNCKSGVANQFGFSQYAGECWHWNYVG